MMNQISQKPGLQPLPHDDRDLHLGAIFNTIPIEEVPMIDFDVAVPHKIKDQKATDFCTAYALTAVSEDQEGIELSPEYQFAQIKELMGDKDSWGADLRVACKSAIEPGSIIQATADSRMLALGIDRYDRSQILDIENWGKEMNTLARYHRKCSYFQIEPMRGSLANGIIASLWTHREEKRSILVGAKWRPEWTDAPGGIIPEEYGDDGYGHAFKVFGVKFINGKRYIKAQLSNGEEIGDKGIFYFPMRVVDKEFTYGAFMFKDIAVEEARTLKKVGIKADDPYWWQWFMRILDIMNV